MAIGTITHTFLRDTAVDFSYPYFFNRLGFITRKPSPLPKLMAIAWPYEKNVWIALSVSVPIFILTFWAFSKIDKNRFKQNCSLGKVSLEVSQMLVMQGTENEQLTLYTNMACNILLLPSRDNKMACGMEWQDFASILGTSIFGLSLW